MYNHRMMVPHHRNRKVVLLHHRNRKVALLHYRRRKAVLLHHRNRKVAPPHHRSRKAAPPHHRSRKAVLLRCRSRKTELYSPQRIMARVLRRRDLGLPGDKAHRPRSTVRPENHKAGLQHQGLMDSDLRWRENKVCRQPSSMLEG